MSLTGAAVGGCAVLGTIWVVVGLAAAGWTAAAIVAVLVLVWSQRWRADRRLLSRPVNPRWRHGDGWWVYAIPYRDEFALFDDEIAYVGITGRRSPLDRWADPGHPAQDPDVDPSAAVVWRYPDEASAREEEAYLIRHFAGRGFRLKNVAGMPRFPPGV